MTYTDLLRFLYQAGYDRIERDDRLLDVFPKESREKGIELWEKWSEHEIKLVRVRWPFDPAKLELFTLARGQVESLLQRNLVAHLEDFDRQPFASSERSGR